ncbi:MAG: EamA family transporter [Akkermansiaceae bacterium]|nr:EamA family transporter [Akkermansiaceae bacterium]
MYAALLTALLFALTGVCAAQASSLLGAGRANAWRLVIALAVLGVWAHGFGSGLGGGVLRWFMCAGGIGFGLGGWCVFQSLRRIGSTLTLLIVECSAALFATAIGWIFLGASLQIGEIALVVLILAGVVMGLAPGLSVVDARSAVRPRRRVILTGTALATAAALLQAVSFNLSRHAFSLLETSGASIKPLDAAYQRLLGGFLVALFLYAVTVCVRRFRPGKPGITSTFPESPLPAPVWVTLNALFGPVLGVTCMLWAISLVANPGLVQAVAASATLLTVPFARRLESSRPGLSYYLGCLLALGGIAGLLLS